MSNSDILPEIGRITLRSIQEDETRLESTSVYEEWGEMAPEAREILFLRWMVEVVSQDGKVAPVGDMSAHAIWYGPTIASKAMNIGISLAEDFRGKGIGSIAQRLLAEKLHALGFVRVEAQTDVDNIPEQKALKKAGFLLEGIARRAQGRADGIHDLQVWSHIFE